MNYWLGLGLLLIVLGGLYLWISRSARTKAGTPLDGSAGGAVVIGYVFPVIGAVFVLVGLLEMML